MPACNVSNIPGHSAHLTATVASSYYQLYGTNPQGNKTTM